MLKKKKVLYFDIQFYFANKLICLLIFFCDILDTFDKSELFYSFNFLFCSYCLILEKLTVKQLTDSLESILTDQLTPDDDY